MRVVSRAAPRGYKTDRLTRWRKEKANWLPGWLTERKGSVFSPSVPSTNITKQKIIRKDLVITKKSLNKDCQHTPDEQQPTMELKKEKKSVHDAFCLHVKTAENKRKKRINTNEWTKICLTYTIKEKNKQKSNRKSQQVVRGELKESPSVHVNRFSLPFTGLLP